MSPVTDSDQRKNDILEAIIEEYIHTGAPVGSELISRKLRQSVSSATIRNVMAELEEKGFLEQPHTSAGRVPTDRGYRYYVDSLMQQARLTPEEAQHLTDIARHNDHAIEQCFARVSELLSQLTHQAAFVVAPTVRQSRITHIQLVPVGPQRLLCTLVGQEATIASHILELSEPMSHDEAASLAHFLNTELSGVPAQELLVMLERRLLAVNDSFYHVIKRSLAILQTAFSTEPEMRLLIDGAIYVFEQPEFRRDPAKAYQLLRALDLRAELLQRMRADLSEVLEHAQGGLAVDEVFVRIGHEVHIRGLEDCSYIFAPFGINRTIVGGLGVLGPRRMDYRRLQALVEGMAERVTRVLTDWQREA